MERYLEGGACVVTGGVWGHVLVERGGGVCGCVLA